MQQGFPFKRQLTPTRQDHEVYFAFATLTADHGFVALATG